MRIEEIHIDGFGRFHSFSVTALRPGLSILLGRNEAGKSTLLAFLRSVLFGLPSRKQAEFYPPLSGGRHGGRVVLVDGEAEQIVVERYAGKGSGTFSATLRSGSQLGEEQFRQRLGMVAADVYEKVFAFGLGELQSFETLQDESIRDAIYSAGMGTGSQSPAQAVRRLSERCERLFKPGGSNPEMNKILKRLIERRKTIDSHAVDLDEYQRVQDELKHVERESAEIASSLHRCRHRQARLQTLQQARDDWILLTDTRKQLQSVPIIESFPHDGVSRLENLLTEQRSLRERLREVGDEKQEAEKELARISVDATLLSLSSEIRGLERRVDLFEQNHQHLTTTRTNLNLTSEQLNQSLRDLGEEWHEDKVREFDLSIPAREKLDAARRACEDVRNRTEKQTGKVELRKQNWQECQETEQAERATLQQLAAPTFKLDVDEIRRLGRNQTAYEAARRDLPRVKEGFRENEQRLNETLRSINPEWTEERLDRFDDSLSAREALNVHRQSLSDLNTRFSQLASHVEEAKRSFREHQSAVERNETALKSLPNPGDADETLLSKRKSRLRVLRLLLTQHGQVQADLVHHQERMHDLREQLSRLEHEDEEASAALPRWLAPGVALLGLLGFLLLGLFREDWVLGSILFVTAMLIAGLLFVFQRTAPARAAAARDRRMHEREQVSRRIAEVESRFQEIGKEERKLRKQIPQCAEAVGISSALSDSLHGTQTGIRAVDEQEERVEQQLSLLQQRRPIEQRLDDYRSQLDRTHDSLRKVKAKLAEVEQQLQEAETDWRTWLKEAELPETLSPDVAINVLSRLESARELRRAIDDQRGRIRDMREEIKYYEESVRTVAKNSGIDDLPTETIAAVQFLSDRLEEQHKCQRDIEEAGRRVTEAGERTAQAAKFLGEAERLHQEELEAQQRAEQQWIELLRRRGLRETLTDAHAEQMIQAIQRARDQLEQLDSYRAEEQTLAEQVTTFLNEVGQIAQEANLPTPQAETVSMRVDTLATGLQQAEAAHRGQEQLRETIQKLNDRIGQLETQIGERQREIDHLLDAAGTNDEESFRQQASDYERLQELGSHVRSLETRLRQLAGSADALAALERELEQSTPEVVQTEQEELNEETTDLEEQKDQSVRVSEQLRLQLQQLENSDEISVLRMQQQADLAEFRNHAREWAVYRMASRLIDRAREMYERERRPAVVKRAEQYFTRLTHGHYREVLIAPEGSLHVVAPDGARKELRHLSRGTAEQLYLSLRFGFVEEFMQRSQPLPLIFDDILVNFDPERSAAAAEVIIELSRNQQILLFTCHPVTVQVLKNLDGAIAVFDLQDGGLTDSE